MKKTISKRVSQNILIILVISIAIFSFVLWQSYKNIPLTNPTNYISTGTIEIEQATSSPQLENQSLENEDIKTTTEKKIQEETKKINKPLKIINKFVQWGYRIPKTPRLIDTIIVHSSYNALGGYIYDVNKIIEEYKMYGVSPHYIIARDGTIYCLVPDRYIAYHAGKSHTPDKRTNVNNFSIGIEIVNSKVSAPTEKQYYYLAQLIKLLKTKYKIKYILGHSQISPGIKTDPWNFNWRKLNSLIQN